MRFRVSGAQGSEQLLFSVLRHGSSKCGTRYCTPLRSRPFSLIPRRLPFPVVCLNQFFFFFLGGGGSIFFPPLCFLDFVDPKKIRMLLYFKICSWNETWHSLRLSIKWPKKWRENHKRKSYSSLFLICCLLWIYPSGKKNKLGRGTLFPISVFLRGRLYYTGYSPFLQDFLNFDTGIKNSTTDKIFFNIFVIWQIEQSGIIAIKTNW